MTISDLSVYRNTDWLFTLSVSASTFEHHLVAEKGSAFNLLKYDVEFGEFVKDHIRANVMPNSSELYEIGDYTAMVGLLRLYNISQRKDKIAALL